MEELKRSYQKEKEHALDYNTKNYNRLMKEKKKEVEEKDQEIEKLNIEAKITRDGGEKKGR